MLERLMLFGASGDLAGRYLLPALAELLEQGLLPAGFQVHGAARQDWDTAAFRAHAASRLQLHAPELAAATREALVQRLHYRQADLADAGHTAAVISAAAGPGAAPLGVYLALPGRLFPTVVSQLGAANLPPGSRIALEKPFGKDLESAIALNQQLAALSESEGEQLAFRVDHVLGMASVQNLIALRMANPVLESIWNSRHVEQVEVLWEETLALEGRAGFYDRAGALKDVLQNHALQVLCLVAMEPPSQLGPELSDRKVEVMRAMRLGDVERTTRRARYTAGTLAPPPAGSGRPVPDYVHEEGVDGARNTETLAQLQLEVDTPRWRGTRFLLRGGKALDRHRLEVVLRFRAPAAPEGRVSELRIGIDGPDRTALTLLGSTTDPARELLPFTLTAPSLPSRLPAYGRVLLDFLRGGRTVSVRGDEAEEAWRVVTPVLDAWREGRVPMEEYPAGSAGPARGPG